MNYIQLSLAGEDLYLADKLCEQFSGEKHICKFLSDIILLSYSAISKKDFVDLDIRDEARRLDTGVMRLPYRFQVFYNGPGHNPVWRSRLQEILCRIRFWRARELVVEDYHIGQKTLQHQGHFQSSVETSLTSEVMTVAYNLDKLVLLLEQKKIFCHKFTVYLDYEKNQSMTVYLKIANPNAR